MIFDGQSLNVYEPVSGKPYPNRVMDLRDDGFGLVVGIGGTTYDQRATTAAVRTDQFAKLSETSVVLDCAGTSDLMVTDVTAAEVYADAGAYADARRAAGVDRYFILTVTPVKEGAPWGWNSTMETKRLAYNDLLRADASGHFDGVIDLATIPESLDPTDTDTYPDGLHPGPELAQLIAELVVETVW